MSLKNNKKKGYDVSVSCGDKRRVSSPSIITFWSWDTKTIENCSDGGWPPGKVHETAEKKKKVPL